MIVTAILTSCENDKEVIVHTLSELLSELKTTAVEQQVEVCTISIKIKEQQHEQKSTV